MHIDITDNKIMKPDHNLYLNEIDDNNSDDVLFENQEMDVEKKMRRGKIEKRRRDRINNSLAELKELVPNAMVKQNSTKLEKAEILKLAVEHLKELKYRDSSVGYFEYMKFYECKISGFRDCLNEVNKYFHREGITNQNSLFQGLMEHLQFLYQTIITNSYYRQELSQNVPSSQLSHLQKPFVSTMDLQNNSNYEKLSSWNQFFPLPYANQNSQYPTQTCHYQPNLLLQLNAYQQSNQYPTNFPSKTNNDLNFLFKYSSESNETPTSHLPVHTSNHVVSSFGNESLNFINTIQSTDGDIP